MRPRILILRHLPLLRNGAAAVAVVLLVWICQVARVDGVPPIWLPSGLVCALAFRWGWSVMPGLWLGSVLGAMQVQAMPGALALGSVLSVEPLMVLLLAARWRGQREVFHAIPKLLLFVLACWLGGMVATLLAGVLPDGLADAIPPLNSRLAGQLTMAPLLLAVLDAKRAEHVQDFRRWDWWLIVAGVLLGWSLVQGGVTPLLRTTPMVPILPLMVMAAFRFQPLGVTVILLVVALVELWIPFLLGAWGAEPFNGVGMRTMQRLVIYSDFITLFVLVVNQERRHLVAGLEAQALLLERQVEERTRELMAANTRLERLSHRDALTGIANRRRFEQVLQREWAQARQAGHSFTVVVFDVDHFKAYNDHYGHPAGDRVLRRVARSLAAGLSPAERHRIARYGGEEFVLVLSGLAEDAAAELAESLRSAVTTLAIPHGLGGSEGVVTLSGGLASCVAQPGRAAKEVVAAADSMLYAAKAAGRNRLCVHPGAPVS
jgi:diguanylate cyclase (GGDEF)-like protein